VTYDDDIATVSGDLRPANPSGQTFTLTGKGATLHVKTEADGAAGSVAGQAPREKAALP